RGLGFDAAEHEAIVDRIIATFDRAYFEKIRGWGSETEAPIFIVGMPRSGSTLVEQILASHPEVHGAGEIGEVHQFITARSAGAPNLYTRPIVSSANDARELAQGYLEALGAGGREFRRVTTKALQNHLHLGVIATLFPRARVIHCRRDPLDTCV